ncbi:MAG: phosphate ABC transporter substrate-binding protein [Candidatus Schekmanbacteria bacterium]|nr:phosphate ABC transporter substrate-binding protein [Candidatus Schekmanbacteria bacterium]
MKSKIWNLFFSALAIAVLTGGCQKPAEKAGGQQEGYITIKGSDTMVHLVTAWVERYMQKKPGVDISVTGGGSGTGIAAMINGSTQIAMSSRDFKAEELKLVKDKGITPIPHTTALDGISVIVNPATTIDELTMEQLRRIFNGTITNWKEVGGPDQPIAILSRESNSGTYVYFQEEVLKKDDYAATARLIPSSAAIIQAAEQDQGVIGYVGIAYAESGKVKTLKVKKTAGEPGVVPTLENIKSGAYPISRPLYLFTNGQPTGESKNFIDFVFSPEGQAIAREVGYIPVK